MSNETEESEVVGVVSCQHKLRHVGNLKGSEFKWIENGNLCSNGGDYGLYQCEVCKDVVIGESQ